MKFLKPIPYMLLRHYKHRRCAGKETIQFYVQKPQGFLGKPSRELIRFAKTELLEPGEGVKAVFLRLTFIHFPPTMTAHYRTCVLLCA